MVCLFGNVCRIWYLTENPWLFPVSSRLRQCAAELFSILQPAARFVKRFKKKKQERKTDIARKKAKRALRLCGGCRKSKIKEASLLKPPLICYSVFSVFRYRKNLYQCPSAFVREPLHIHGNAPRCSQADSSAVVHLLHEPHGVKILSHLSLTVNHNLFQRPLT